MFDFPEAELIRQENRYNMDEIWIIADQETNRLVLGSLERKNALIKQPVLQVSMSIVETISATDQALSPLVILNGKTVQQEWFPENWKSIDKWDFTSTEEGYTFDNPAVHWLETIFFPQTKPQQPEEKRLLIFDGQGSNGMDEFIFKC